VLVSLLSRGAHGKYDPRRAGLSLGSPLAAPQLTCGLPRQRRPAAPVSSAPGGAGGRKARSVLRALAPRTPSASRPPAACSAPSPAPTRPSLSPSPAASAHTNTAPAASAHINTAQKSRAQGEGFTPFTPSCLRAHPPVRAPEAAVGPRTKTSSCPCRYCPCAPACLGAHPGPALTLSSASVPAQPMLSSCLEALWELCQGAIWGAPRALH